jgi:hypothetical protein
MGNPSEFVRANEGGDHVGADADCADGVENGDQHQARLNKTP